MKIRWYKSPLFYLSLVGLGGLFFLGLAGWQAWANRNVHAAVEQLKAVDLAPLLAPLPVSIEELVPFRKEPGNAAEDLLKVSGRRSLLASYRAPGLSHPGAIADAMFRASGKTLCDWHAPGCLVVTFPTREHPEWGKLQKAAKTLKAEADELTRQGNFKEAERRLLALISLGSHLKRNQTYMGYAVGNGMQHEGSKDLPSLYHRMGDALKRDRAQRYYDDLRGRERALRNVTRFLWGGSMTMLGSLASTQEGVGAWKRLVSYPGLVEVLLWEGVFNVAYAGELLPLEIIFGPAKFREDAVLAMTQRGDSATQDMGKAVVAYLQESKAKGFWGRLSLIKKWW